jgi:hypothetical protein
LRHQYFNLAKHHHDLLRAEPLLRHDPCSSPGPFSLKTWSKKLRSGHLPTAIKF